MRNSLGCAGLIGLIGLVAALIGIFSFVTGKYSLPDLLRHTNNPLHTSPSQPQDPQSSHIIKPQVETVAQPSITTRQGTSGGATLGENISRFSRYLQQNDILSGDFQDYQLVMPPTVIGDASKVTPSVNTYDIAFVGPSFYTFHSFDGGVTWMPMPPRDRLLVRLSKEYAKGKRSRDWQKEIEQILAAATTVEIVTVELPQYDWDTSRLNYSYYRNEKAKLHWWLEDELKQHPHYRQAIEGLAEAVHRQADGCGTTIYEYSQRGQNLWVAGAYTTIHEWASGTEYRLANKEDRNGTSRGFICFSSDNGKSWVRQWFSERKHPDPVYGIYFADLYEGWALSLKGILHTNKGGASWERVFEDPTSIGNLFILSKRKWVVTDSAPPGLWFYRTENAGVSWEKVGITPETRQEVQKAIEDVGGPAMHYGGIYSYQTGK